MGVSDIAGHMKNKRDNYSEEISVYISKESGHFKTIASKDNYLSLAVAKDVYCISL